MLPKLPTDNLYKFVAIFGLVLLGGFAFLRLSTNAKHHANMVVYNVEAVENTSKRERLQREIAELEETEVEGDFLVNGIIHKSRSEARAALHSLELAYGKEATDLRLRQSALSASEGDMKTLWYGGQALEWLGGILMVIGFAFWYFKVQRHQDAILFAQRFSPIDKKTGGSAEVEIAETVAAATQDMGDDTMNDHS